MLEPREADLPALFLVFVVLPLVTYILLGICNEANKKKERVSMLAQMAAEEAFRAEASSTARIIPLVSPPKPRIHECARCFAPATTRCSRCKSVRYCSGKCQIIHWRQGHKQECQEADAAISNLSANLASAESAYRRGQLDEKGEMLNDVPLNISDDPTIGFTGVASSPSRNDINNPSTFIHGQGTQRYSKHESHNLSTTIEVFRNQITLLLASLEQVLTQLYQCKVAVTCYTWMIKGRQALFPYEDLVKFFQCEIWDFSPRGLLNCGNRLLLMSMQSICLEDLGGENQVDSRVQETTLIQQIFGGRLRSKVKCLRCHHESERYENIMDLTLEILDWVESLEDALAQFTAAEDLDGENMYRCGRCATYVRARKQLSVHEAPNILTIVLKRFQSGKYGKITKCVSFPDMLDMIPFMTGTGDSPPLYMLYAVVVHLDAFNASFSGHYVSYVKDLQGTWFKIDDTEVQPVPMSQVMSEGAYILFYSRSYPRPPRIYNGKVVPSQAPMKHNSFKIQKTSNHGQNKSPVPSFEPEVPHYEYDGEWEGHDQFLRPGTNRGEYGESAWMDLSDSTSSDWSLFTSSDEASFTTESTRDSFSTADCADATNFDSISSIFSSFYGPEYPPNSTISCKKFWPCKSQTRFFKETNRFVSDSSLVDGKLDSVHRQGLTKGVMGQRGVSGVCIGGRLVGSSRLVRGGY
ncbi:Ubiquitin carboxyl-terminal hydrolase 15 [Acorus calamus]|uniref:Ubiquitin carboxyl-terminal hydrolase 15 n=1 Tax=Acorus calamus TaxID=4465 RepID=A0AAV9DN06_ACOCL|nr:Ubiquitin carboxyl-terminal hydrolase 15 [Acorus calamus]